MGWLAGGPATMAATNKCLAQSNKSPHRANATKKRKIKPTTKDQNMTRLLLCTAALLILTPAFATPANAVPRFCYSLRTGQFAHWGPCRVVCNYYGRGGYCR